MGSFQPGTRITALDQSQRQVPLSANHSARCRPRPIIAPGNPCGRDAFQTVHSPSCTYISLVYYFSILLFSHTLYIGRNETHGLHSIVLDVTRCGSAQVAL